MMQINLIVIRTDKPKELSEFYKQIGMKFEYTECELVCKNQGVGILDKYNYKYVSNAKYW